MTPPPAIRISKTEELLLDILLAKPSREVYGLEFVRESNGAVARGSVYVLLDRLEEKGLVESRQEEKDPTVPGIPRRLYTITGHGRLVLKTWQRLRTMRAGLPALAGGGQ